MSIRHDILYALGLGALLAFGQPCAAQDREEISAYQDEAGARMILFRGEQAESYTFLANGNPFWTSAEYRTGNIVVQGRSYYGVQVNLDAVQQRALVRVQGSPVAVSLAPARVSSIELENARFVGIGPGGALPEGFYQVFGTGAEKVFKAEHKYLASSADNVNGETIGYYDKNYRYDLTRYFALRTEYWFLDAEGNFSRVRGKGALLGKFGPRKKAIRKAMNGTGIDRLPFDAYCEAVLKIAAQ